jgi:hypothetical protein
VEHGSLYPVLHRLISGAGLQSRKALLRTIARRSFTGLPPQGRRQLELETSKWDKLAGAIARVLRLAEGERE